MKVYFFISKQDAWKIGVICEFHDMPLETKMLKKKSQYCYIKMSDYEFDLAVSQPIFSGGKQIEND